MNLHNINVIAGYEVKLLRRSWLFRIFAILALLLLTIVQISQLTPAFWKYNETWAKTALTSMIPFYSIYLYNIAQSVIVIFLAGSFLKRDKKLDTAEVIYVRPMSNADYIVGKVWGILRVFVSLNIITFAISIFLNLAISQSPFSIFPYVFYLLTISIPSLLFILGLSFTMMCLLKNQAVTFIVMLGIVGTVFFYLSDTFYGLFDFFGVNIPAIFSDITGHANLSLFLLQRTIYLLAGVGLICFTISLVKRLPHRPWKTIIINILGTVLIIAGCVAGLLYTLHFRHIIQVRNEYIQSFNKVVDTEKVSVLSNNITIEQRGRQLEGTSKMKIKNQNSSAIDHIILYLNPSLQIISAESNGSTLNFSRDNQVISISRELQPEEEIILNLKYRGGIDENICYTDIDEKDFLENPASSNLNFRYGKRYAYLDDKYTLLTPECLWYPVSIPPVNPAVPYDLKKNFTDFTLTILQSGNRTILSQGKMTQEGNKTVFTNRQPLPGISLTIGDYDKKEISVDSTNYAIYYFKGHDFFSRYFNEVSDTLPAVIQDIRNDLEIKKNRSYPFEKFVLAETPVQFSGYIRNWKGYTESVMPEIIFVPERGVGTSSDFRALTNRTRDWRRGPEEFVDEKELQTEMLKSYIQTAFVEESAPLEGGRWNNSPDVNKLNLGPLFFGHTSFIHSKVYPVVDVAINTMLNSATPSGRMMWAGGMAISDPQRANLYLQQHSFREATRDTAMKPQIFYELLKLKSAYLKNYITSQISVEEFNSFMKNFLNDHSFSVARLEDFISQFQEKFNIDLGPFIDQWYNINHSPTLTIRDVDANKIVIDDYTKYQIRFKVNNPSDVNGIITVKTIDGGRRGGGPRGFGGGANEQDNTKVYIIPPHSAQEIKLINDERPGRMTVNTTISNNLPNDFSFNFSKIDNEISDTTSGIFAISNQVFMPSPDEIIVDNEDSGFRILEANTKHKLKDMFRKEEDEKYKNFFPWRFPTKWTATVSGNCYGTAVNSAYYKKKGTGANKAEWTTNIPKSNYYEVYIWNPSFDNMMMTMGRRGGGHEREERSQTYTIRYDVEAEDIKIDLAQEETGWVSIGNFFLPEGDVTITLSDKVTGEYVVADAVRFVKINN